MFGRTSPVLDVDDPHLEVTVTPAQSAFYAGELFSAVITLRNTRTPVRASYSQPSSPNPHFLLSRNGAASPLQSPGGSSPKYDDWRGHARKTSGGRRSQSLALGKGMTPQEIVWALDDDKSPTPQIGPPPLSGRRAPSIPSAHPHARKVSIASTSAFTPPPVPPISLPEEPSTLEDAFSPRPPSRATPRASPILSDVTEELLRPGTRASSGSDRTPSPISPPFQPISSPLSTSPDTSARSLGRSSHRRAPSYQNSYGASFLTPPQSLPLRRSATQTGVTTVLWGHTRLVARFAPSNTYIPPDPLLPLRAKLLHQPIGSGSLATQGPDKPSRWGLNFGTGTIGDGTQPSLTGSLFGLAKGLVYGGTGGSLEEERKRVWTTQELPVLETTRSLMGVDIKLQEGETREFVYTLQLPAILPPVFKGRALRFSYELILSLNVALPGGGKRQRTKEIVVPVRVWPNVQLHQMLRTYDVLQPVIQTAETGSIEERSTVPATPRRPQHMIEPPQSIDSLAAYARRLVDSVDTRRAPPSPSKNLRPLGPPRERRSSFLLEPRPRSLSSATAPGDDELVEEEQGCGEAVEILSRHSPKASYDIRQDGEVVAVLTLIKTTYRLGETVTGVVTFNTRQDRRVLKFSAYLETNEVIPEPLLPPDGRRPDLRRLHAEQRSSYAQFTARTAFSLDIPSDATPAFSLAAGEGDRGGLQWRVRLAFLVASPRNRDGAEENKSECLHLVPVEADGDNATYTASSGLVPFIATREGWAEARAETVECEVPVQVLAGNTAFVVRPSVFTV
ncbi:hypothetical protein CspeluHIS016_0306400 [Cutaneotrichosporon spelunceum]|uniref:Rgp1-domain-containing protein n=1 Tax=Cutaneotrichosporon spelunceum TaxID=1672016 RepID=A0AAD3TUN7_9TREE|nr:hypothetical protein CspeluHIS016_0306400 [Cutaneotrichosporon spelunceum]